MLNILKWLIGAMLAVMLFGGGYSFGARKVEALEARIAKIKEAGDDAEASRATTQSGIDKALTDRAAEHAQQLDELKNESARREKELAAALAGANTRIAALQTQAAASNAQRAKLAADMAAASAAERRSLQDQLDKLDRGQKELADARDGNRCLALAVPDALIKPLLGQEGSR